MGFQEDGDCSDIILEDYYKKFYKLKYYKASGYSYKLFKWDKNKKKKSDFLKFFHDNTEVHIKFIQISSLSVYSPDQNKYLNENSTLNPKSKYGKIKFNMKNIKKFNYFNKFLILRVEVFTEKKNQKY